MLMALSGQVVVDLAELKLYLYKDGELVKRYPVAAGGPEFPTPTGTFAVTSKEMNPTWYPAELGVGEGRRAYPAGHREPARHPLDRDQRAGVGIHGTPSPGSIGTYASHGCIRMYISDVEELFERVAVGMPVLIRRSEPGAIPGLRSEHVRRREIIPLPRELRLRPVEDRYRVVLDDVVAPPYDVISRDEAAGLRARSPYNAVARRPPGPATPGEGDPTGAPPRRWPRGGGRRGAPRPTALPLPRRRDLPRVRTASSARAAGSSRDSGSAPSTKACVLPHEKTHAGPKLDRLRLWRATRTTISPIFLLFPDDRGTVGAARWGGRPTRPPPAPAPPDRPRPRRQRSRRDPDRGTGGRGSRRGPARRATVHRRRTPPLRDGARLPRRAACGRRPRRRRAHGLPLQHARPGARCLPHPPPAEGRRDPGDGRGARAPAAQVQHLRRERGRRRRLRRDDATPGRLRRPRQGLRPLLSARARLLHRRAPRPRRRRPPPGRGLLTRRGTALGHRPALPDPARCPGGRPGRDRGPDRLRDQPGRGLRPPAERRLRPGSVHQRHPGRGGARRRRAGRDDAPEVDVLLPQAAHRPGLRPHGRGQAHGRATWSSSSCSSRRC